MRKYWELRSEDKVAEADDPQNAFAQEFFQYYLAHPRTKTGRQALSSAFVMWGNIGEIDQVKKAIPQIDIHADVWSPILSGIGNAFSKNNQGDEFIALLHDFESKLTHPASKTAVFNRLGDYYLGKDDGGRAKDFFQRIVSLDADSFYV
ncbi:MAG: hypothetical protein ACE5I1_29740, partial [bacterium]